MNNKVLEFKKDLIISTAHKYFQELSYSGVQVDKIAKELGIGVGTIYSIFGSKEGLFLSWLFSLIERAYTEIKTIFEKEKNPLLRLELYASYKLNYYEINKAVLSDYMQNNLFFLKNTTRGEENPMKKIYSLLESTIDELVQGKKLDTSTKDNLLLAYMFDSILNSFIERFCADSDVNYVTKTKDTVRMFLNTIGLKALEYEI